MQTTTQEHTAISGLNATYSPEDNKLRLYSVARLDAELYAKVKAAGFIYAPKQGLFVAPMWTPGREDLLLSLCGEIGDEDTSLVDRAEQRAERFGDYSERRAGDADRARAGIAAIAENIPFGQPILVGHHSERRARKDAERIESGMRKAVQMWDQSEYWKDRAQGAVQHAKYKELPAVRARRIKGLEADKRKQERTISDSEKFLKAWQKDGLTLEQAKHVSGFDNLSRCFTLADFPRVPPASQYEGTMGLYSALDGGVITLEQARDMAVRHHHRVIARATRWLSHYENRISYERAMLGEQGGLVGEAADLQPGGRVLIRGEWLTIVRVTKKDGKPVSVSTNARFCRVRNIEEITKYEPPVAEVAEAVAAAVKLAPIVNYPGEGFIEITKAQWEAISKDYRGYQKRAATDTTGPHRVRKAMGCFLPLTGSDANKRHSYLPVFVTDEKRKEAPALVAATSPTVAIPKPEREMVPAPTPAAPKPQEPREPSDIEAMRSQLKTGGVQVVSADQLFPTPAALAARMVELAGVDAGHRVLEPEAGTGAILRELARAVSLDEIDLHAVELNQSLARALGASFPAATITQGDFMAYRPASDGPLFDRILMNPPFSDAQDIRHILYARTLLAPGGRLVAICLNGSRQNATLKPIIEEAGGTWEPLPSGTFESSGTGVSTVLIVLDAD